MQYSIKSVKFFNADHEGEKGFSLTLLIDGIPFSKVEYDGWGGPYSYSATTESVANFDVRFKEIQSLLAKEEIGAIRGVMLYNSLSNIVSKEIDKYLLEKEYQKTIKLLGYVSNGEIYTYPAKKHKLTPENIEGIKKAKFWKPENRMLQEVPKDELLAILKG
jgi:hypothetical protein